MKTGLLPVLSAIQQEQKAFFEMFVSNSFCYLFLIYFNPQRFKKKLS